jgi:hypothetical protein
VSLFAVAGVVVSAAGCVGWAVSSAPVVATGLVMMPPACAAAA